MSTARTRINHQIQAPELRVIGENGENLGILSLKSALEKAQEAGLDLIEISPAAVPPVAKIMDYGRFQYDANKREKASKAKSKATEVKNLQIKIGTSEHDLELKAKKASEWLNEGHKIKLDLFLIGRSRYMDMKFLEGRLDRILRLVSVEYKISDPAKKSPKGVSLIIEKK